ncbi:hypothetical protein QYF36_025730 [Acer negundo]|nr:hypothetical protein QYF36_025730 [Acer negundo]
MQNEGNASSDKGRNLGAVESPRAEEIRVMLGKKSSTLATKEGGPNVKTGLTRKSVMTTESKSLGVHSCLVSSIISLKDGRTVVETCVDLEGILDMEEIEASSENPHSDEIFVTLKKKILKKWKRNARSGQILQNTVNAISDMGTIKSSLPYVPGNDSVHFEEGSGQVGRSEKSLLEMSLFRQAVEDSDLIDHGFSGLKFTWNNRRDGMSNIQERRATESVMPKLNDEMRDGLSEVFRSDEVKIAIFEMGPTKAPGHDDFQALFF